MAAKLISGNLSGFIRNLLFNRSTLILQKRSTPLQSFGARRFFVDKNDGTDDDPENKKDDEPRSRDKNQQMLDVSEYYSQYIKEYEQGGFKDEASVQWELRREKMGMVRGRGQTGVMDVEEIVEFLRAERVKNVCTLRMPSNLAYAPHMVIGTPLSRRHLNVVTEKLTKLYKKKRDLYDPETIRIEGEKNFEWRVFDTGNVVAHLMMQASREKYDIEMLWTVGPDHDDLTNAQGELDEYGDRLKKLQDDIDSLSNSDSTLHQDMNSLSSSNSSETEVRREKL